MTSFFVGSTVVNDTQRALASMVDIMDHANPEFDGFGINTTMFVTNVACDVIVKRTLLADGWDWNKEYVDYVYNGTRPLALAFATLDMYYYKH